MGRNKRATTIFDRCFNVLEKALQILEGFTSSYKEIIGTPNWSSIPSNEYIILFL